MKFIIRYQKRKLKDQTKIVIIEQALIILMLFHQKYTKWIFNSSKCLIIRVALLSAMAMLIHKTNTQVIRETDPGNVSSQPSHSLNQLRNWASHKNLVRGFNLEIETWVNHEADRPTKPVATRPSKTAEWKKTNIGGNKMVNLLVKKDCKKEQICHRQIFKRIKAPNIKTWLNQFLRNEMIFRKYWWSCKTQIKAMRINLKNIPTCFMIKMSEWNWPRRLPSRL